MNTLTTINKTELFNPEINFEYFADFAKHFIKKMESGQVLTKKKVKFSADTIRQYNVSIAHFEKFEESLNGRVKIYQINKKLLEAFEKYLYDTGLLFNSVYLYISKIKAIGNILFDEEQINRPVKFSTPKKLTTQIYLTQQELKKMKECQDLTDSERQVLDVFLVQCFTGMRYSSVVEFLSNPLAYIKQLGEATYIDIISQKTGEQSIIPLSKVVFELLNKYKFKFELKSEEFMNRAIKKIAEKSGIDNPIAIQITKESITETKIVPKYKKISTHTCRRSYLTLIKQYISDDEAIMAISGHTSSQAMRNYVRSSKLDRILPYMDNDFFKLEI